MNYPPAYNDGTRVLNAEERNNKVKFHQNNKHDLIYSGLNVGLVKAYLSAKKNKSKTADGQIILASLWMENVAYRIKFHGSGWYERMATQTISPDQRD